MTNQQPITPPSELVEQWEDVKDFPTFQDIATQAARWGWDQRNATVPAELQQARDEELEACCKWVSKFNYDNYHYQDELRAARRPKPPSLKELALADLDRLMDELVGTERLPTIASLRRALEALPE
jgi:hypothetical protein